MAGSQTICGRGPNTPAMMLAGTLADQGYLVPIAAMEAALEACRPQAWIDEHGALRAPDGYAFDFVDAPGHRRKRLPTEDRAAGAAPKFHFGTNPMKHCSAAALDRVAVRTEEDLLAMVRARLDGTPAGKAALAPRLGLSEWRLSMVLRGRQKLPDGAAEKLGYRKVTRFERVS